MKPWTWILFVGCLASLSPAQSLRHGVAAADRVVAGKVVSSQPWGEHFVLHELQVAQTIKGEPATSLMVVEMKGVSLHARPTPGETRIYCLHNYGKAADRADLPAAMGPFFKMSGYPGSSPSVGENLQDDPRMTLIRIVLDAEIGVSTAQTAFNLVDLALSGGPSVRGEAVAMLTERPVLRGKLSTVHWGEILSRVAAETEDIPFKISLAHLCAEQRLEGLVDALCLSIGDVEDVSYSQVVGRIARSLHGENALDMLRPHILRATRDARGRLLMALGATSTETALNALLQMRRLGSDPYVDAALREHGSPRAKAVLKNKKDG